MAKPRVFISSTYYDLKTVRADLEHFIRDRGYDPILNERGSIAYAKEQSPEQSCYREIETSDILISIIGGRFGSTSQAGPYSISQTELRTAIEQYKQVYIFVDRDVLTEHRTFQRNRATEIKWVSVDDTAIFKFLDEIFALPNNNPIMPFETSQEILNLLREQWAGLFQRMLQQSAVEGQLSAARELRQGMDTVRRLVELLASKTEGAQDAIASVLLANHPIFSRIQRLLKVPYRVFFTNLDELNSWLTTRGFDEVTREAWDEDGMREWVNRRNSDVWDLLKVDCRLFDEDGRLIADALPWDETYVRREVRQRSEPPDPADDDPPF